MVKSAHLAMQQVTARIRSSTGSTNNRRELWGTHQKLHAEISISQSRCYCPGLTQFNPCNCIHRRNSACNSNTPKEVRSSFSNLRNAAAFWLARTRVFLPEPSRSELLRLELNRCRLKEGNKSGTRFWRRWEPCMTSAKKKPKLAGAAAKWNRIMYYPRIPANCCLVCRYPTNPVCKTCM